MVPQRSVLSAESGAQFQEGIGLVLSRWYTLQFAVANETGGPHSRLKAHQLANDIFSWFTQSKEQLYIDDLEGMLDEFMLSLNMVMYDDSVEDVEEDMQIAKKLMIMHEECLEGNYQSIQTLREANPPAAVVPHIQGGDSDDEDDDDDGDNNNDSSVMEIDAPNFQSNRNHREMMGDEPGPSEKDGWTVVAPRRNRGTRRRNRSQVIST